MRRMKRESLAQEKFIHIRVFEEEYQKLKSTALRAGLSVSEYVRRILFSSESVSAVHLSDITPYPSENLPLVSIESAKGLSDFDQPRIHPQQENFSDGPLLESESKKKELPQSESGLKEGGVDAHVSRLTGHSIGCNCFHCVQTRRFAHEQSRPKPERKTRMSKVKKGNKHRNAAVNLD